MEIAAIILALGASFALGMYVVTQLEKNIKINKFKNDLENYDKKEKAGEQKPKVQRRTNTKRKSYRKKKANVQSKN